MGLGKAAELAEAELAGRARHAAALRQRLWEGIQRRVPGVVLNGPPLERLPGNLSLSIAGVEGEMLLLNLDYRGIAVSAGSACAAGSLEPSHVLRAMGLPRETAVGSLRLSLGRDNTEEDVDYVVDQVSSAVEKIRSLQVGAAGH